MRSRVLRGGARFSGLWTRRKRLLLSFSSKAKNQLTRLSSTGSLTLSDTTASLPKAQLPPTSTPSIRSPRTPRTAPSLTEAQTAVSNFGMRTEIAGLKECSKVGGPITATAFNGDGTLVAYSVTYDWSMGYAFSGP